MKYKIPVSVQASVVVEVEAKNLNDACMKAMTIPSLKKRSSTVVFDDAIPIVDERRLEEMYPAEVARDREEAKPYWEKMGWKQVGNDNWTKGNATISNSFDDVGWGFRGTVWAGCDGKSGFTSLEEAINWAEKHI